MTNEGGSDRSRRTSPIYHQRVSLLQFSAEDRNTVAPIARVTTTFDNDVWGVLYASSRAEFSTGGIEPPADLWRRLFGAGAGRLARRRCAASR